MSYSIDFEKVTISMYKKELLKRQLIPSRQILKNEADVHFDAFKKAGIKTLGRLFAVLKNNKAKSELLNIDNVSDEYLAILLRELKSILPASVKLNEFHWISDNTIKKINAIGIRNSRELYEKFWKSKDRKDFVNVTGIDEKDIVELLKLSDLTRIQWVNSTFAHVLFLAGFDTVRKVSDASPEDMFTKVTQKNIELKLYKGNIGLNDMKLCIEAAKLIDAEIEV
ncbi:MAG TPA: DUF4332 domain-containing protein [Spirochaetota bacterium]|nr:DUF4332 domain-containing protein [Spirochaetota bacterium]HOH36831.1 DUF4332 domain-containing protein [Spirochaetota bacterium]HPY01910.1 DUF4332 domain-containing protein [Spirochaetota bacterium]HQA51771.1 DUF4332 domain-containing protein [Spirochaetota bacterium]